MLEKSNGLFDLELNVVFARFGSDADLLELRLVLFAFCRPLTFVVLKFAKIHDSANRRLGFGSHFDQIEPVFAGFGKCVSCGNDA